MWLEILLLVSIAFSIYTTIYLAMKRPSENQKWMQLAIICSAASELLYYYEIQVNSIYAMESFYNLGFVMKCFAMLCFWLFISYYCNMPIRKKTSHVLLAWAIVISSMVMSNKFHGIVYQTVGRGDDFIVPYLVVKPGLVYYLFAYSMFGIMIVCDFKIIMKMRVSKGVERTRLNFLFLAVTIPIVGLCLKMFVLAGRVDATVLGMLLSTVILLILARKFGILDTVQIARDNIVENTKEGLIVVDADYNLLYANPAVVERYAEVAELSTPKKREGLKRMFQHPESVYNEQGGYFEVRVSSLYEGKTLRGYMAWIFDMSFINEYTNEILYLKDEAEKANHAKSLFLANMSHEIRTPMNAILGFSELILQEKNNPPLTQEYASDIKRSAKNLLHIINEVLDFSKIEAGKAEIIEEKYYTQSLLEDVSLLIAHQAAEKNLTYIPQIDKTLPYQLRGSAKSIREILTNILNNAVKYTKQGTITLEVSCKERKEKSVQLQFVVQDTGIGMKQEDVDKIFEKFSQFDTTMNRNVEGTGLGMSIVKALIEQMGGEILIDSEYGRGTKMTILLEQEIVDERPIGEVRLGMEELEQKSRRQEFTTTAKILVVDDNETNLKVTAGLLKKYGICADIADSGFKALEQVKVQEYDIVFLDHMMPEMDGVETMQKMREMSDGKYKNLSIIALTANAISGVKEQMIAQGFTDYLSKPIDVEKLERSLIKHLPADKIFYSTNTKQIISDSEDFKQSEAAAKEEMENTSEVENIKHLNIATGIHNCGGTIEEYYQILGVVIKYGSNRIQKLKQLMEAQDFENYTIDVHALKSTAANIGAMELSQMAFEQEMAGKQKNYELIKEKYQSLLDLYQAVLDESTKILQSRKDVSFEKGMPSDSASQRNEKTQVKDDASEEKFEIPKEELIKLLQNVSILLEEFELERAEAILKETDQFLLEDSITDKINEAIQKLQDCDIDGAEACIQSII